MTGLLAFAAACAASAWLGLYFPEPVPGTPLVALWAPAGVLLAALSRTAPARWPAWLAVAAITIGAVLRSGGLSWTLAAATAALTIAEAAVAAAVLRRTIGGARLTLTRVAHTVALVTVAATVPLASGLVAAAGLAQVHDVPFLIAWRGWWFGTMLGMLLFGAFASAVMEGAGAFVHRVAPRPLLEAGAAVTASIVIGWLVFGEGAPRVFRVPAYGLPVLLGAAFRLAPGGAVATLLGICLIGLHYTSHGLGPLALGSAPPADWILRSQGALTTASVSIVLLASVVAERKQTALDHAALLGELQTALAEIKTLRGLIPICAWCQKVRDDAGFWQEIQSYVHTHTDATFSHSICPQCSDEMHGTIATMRSDLHQ